MNRNHEDFEVMCALTMNGNLTRMEREELREHVENCVPCYTRLVEMRRVAIHLLLVQACKTPDKRPQKGMQERFAARAISEGIPLTPRSQGIGFRALGLVTVLLVVLLLVTGTLGDDPYKSVLKNDMPSTTRMSASPPFENVSPEGVANDSPGKVRTGRALSRQLRLGAHRPSFDIATRPGLAAIDPGLWQSRRFTFTPYSRNFGLRPHPLSTTLILPEVVPSFVSPRHVPELTLDATSEVFRHNAPHLLAEFERGVFDPSTYKGNAFQIFHVVVPQAIDRERPQ
jgi:hypothetical protein